VPFAILHCEAPQDLLIERLRSRAARGDDPSEADAQVLALQRQIEEPLREDEWAQVVEASAAPGSVPRGPARGDDTQPAAGVPSPGRPSSIP